MLPLAMVAKNSCPFVPRADIVVLEPDVDPKGARATTGVVSAVGPAVNFGRDTRQHVWIELGDRVVYAKYGGTTMEHEGVRYLLLRESEIFAKVVVGA